MLEGVVSSPTKWLQESEFYGNVMREDGYHSLLGDILTARSQTLTCQSTALPIALSPRGRRGSASLGTRSDRHPQ